MNTLPSLAGELFARIQNPSEGVSSFDYIKALINSHPPTFETEHLDFKAGCRENDGTEIDDADVRKTWSEAVGAFANTGGGVLIWGVKAKKTTTASGREIDAACGLLEVPDVYALRSRLQELAHEAADPPVQGIQVATAPNPANPPRGFVVCLIPESHFKPHRAELAKRRWLIRIVDSFVDAPVPVLRSLFFPRRATKIDVEIAYGPPQAAADGNLFRYAIGLRNTGMSTAEDVLFCVEHISTLGVTAPYRWSTSKQGSVWLVRLPISIHPGEQVDGITFQLTGGPGVSPFFKMRVFAKDQAPSQYEAQVTPETRSPISVHPRSLEF